MITRDNFIDVIRKVTDEQVEQLVNVWDEYILLEVHCSNACSWVDILSVEYSEEMEMEANDNGQLFCSFDDFIILLEEQDVKGLPIAKLLEV